MNALAGTGVLGRGPGNPGRRLPHVLLDEEESGSTLSLSHHGKLAAWVLGAALTFPDSDGSAEGG